MKEFKVIVGFDVEGKIVSIDPKYKVNSRVVRYTPMIARLLTFDEVDREIKETMQLDCHAYKTVNRRIRQVR